MHQEILQSLGVPRQTGEKVVLIGMCQSTSSKDKENIFLGLPVL